MTIKVTQDDIDFGNRESAYYCPVARAINNKLGCQAIVGGHSVVLWTAYSRKKVQLPQSAQTFIHMFDCYGSSRVRPFHFELDIP